MEKQVRKAKPEDTKNKLLYEYLYLGSEGLEETGGAMAMALDRSPNSAETNS